MPPSPETVEFYGCAISQRASTKQLLGGWYTVVWADREHKNQSPHDWAALYSVRDGRSQALKDCDQWMDGMAKAIAQAKKAKP